MDSISPRKPDPNGCCLSRFLGASIAMGRLDEDDARTLIDNYPQITTMMIGNLQRFGGVRCLDNKDLLSLARQGFLSGEVLDVALGVVR